MYAVQSGSLETVEFILEHASETIITMVDILGETALELAPDNDDNKNYAIYALINWHLSAFKAKAIQETLITHFTGMMNTTMTLQQQSTRRMIEEMQAQHAAQLARIMAVNSQ